MLNNKIIRIICAILILALMSFSMFIVSEYLISLVLMEDKITFSSSVFMTFFSFPLVLYYIVFIVFVNVVGRYPKHHDSFNKYLCLIALVSIVLSFPISFYVHYKLKSDGYLVCPRISWSSPNTYVKDMKLCD
ncbi:DUF1240 domain-containing protein [Photorhabdus laumondii subsp. laumondii]|uniref:Photorhabdus luminescens subsp. laumondii TTO1 complete genome segment 2/17 n=3 Tax=Photorhabdus TaxID=29487 RepID=Q7N9D4_PHOLL|nr:MULTISPECIES: DUF1240 domain-containing protein [Photorhabdus]AWK40376.1 hypothetical protein A4R40_01990 [Photorhabdus laumondii subsp. laumondii]AXG41187.1 DUF1240 domain-containing protein [Photorhabdus laumondii subsp. laumondii]AXG45717.1 DUF1240 domain-containing protein [Photorhabdus laumondii subsp. laumondii]KTL62729.1 hypothetical protein AA106_05215 [Photorhabdus laumondii subsp. laumondii]MCC8383480.1 DUF1240 domain-containing protein [Photorhabdus laumondii]